MSNLKHLSTSIFILLLFTACSQKSTKECEEKSMFKEAEGGTKLASMQCYYHGKEKKLLMEIRRNLQKQKKLSAVTNDLNKRMTSLYNEIKNFKNEENISQSKKDKLYEEITVREEEIDTLQKINTRLLYNSNDYYKNIKNREYIEKDREEIDILLKKMIKILKKIEAASIYNLDKLQEFKMRIS